MAKLTMGNGEVERSRNQRECSRLKRARFFKSYACLIRMIRVVGMDWEFLRFFVVFFLLYLSLFCYVNCLGELREDTSGFCWLLGLYARFILHWNVWIGGIWGEHLFTLEIVPTVTELLCCGFGEFEASISES